MVLVLDDLPRDPDRLLPMLQQMVEVNAQQNAALVLLQDERDTALAERDTAQAEIEKLRLLIRQLQRGQFGRRSEKLDPDQLVWGFCCPALNLDAGPTPVSRSHGDCGSGTTI